METLAADAEIVPLVNLDPRLVADIERNGLLRRDDPNAIRILEYLSERRGQAVEQAQMVEDLELHPSYVRNFIELVVDATKRAADFFHFKLESGVKTDRVCKCEALTPSSSTEDLIEAVGAIENLHRKNLCTAFLILYASLGQNLSKKDIVDAAPYEINPTSIPKALDALEKLLSERADLIPFRLDVVQGRPCKPSEYTLHHNSGDSPADIRYFLPLLCMNSPILRQVYMRLIDDREIDFDTLCEELGIGASTLADAMSSLSKFHNRAPALFGHVFSRETVRRATLTFNFTSEKVKRKRSKSDGIDFMNRTSDHINVIGRTRALARACSNVGTVPFDNTEKDQHQFLLNNSTWCLLAEDYYPAVIDCLMRYAYEEKTVHTRVLAIEIATQHKISIEEAMRAMKGVERKMENNSLELGFTVFRDGPYWTMFFLSPEERIREVSSRYDLRTAKDLDNVCFFDPAIKFTSAMFRRRLKEAASDNRFSEDEDRILRFVGDEQIEGKHPGIKDIQRQFQMGQKRIVTAETNLFENRFDRWVYQRTRVGRRGGREVVMLCYTDNARQTALGL